MSHEPRKAIDISSLFIPEGTPEFTPPPAHDEAIIAARKAQPAGTLVIEQQYLGAETALQFYKLLAAPSMPKSNVEIGAAVIAGSAVGASRALLHEGAQQPDTRRLWIPRLIDPETGEPFTAKELHSVTVAALGHLVDDCEIAYYRKRSKGKVSIKMSHTLGREAARTAVLVSLLPHCQEVENAASEIEVQQLAVDSVKGAMKKARELGMSFGAHLSLASLSQPETGLTNTLNKDPGYVPAYAALVKAQAIARSLIPAS